MKWICTVVLMLLCLALAFSSTGCATSEEPPQDSLTTDTTPPSAPTNLTKTTPDSDYTPTFTWSPANDTDSGVALYLARTDSGSFVSIGKVTSYTVLTTLSEGSHTFEVKAADNAGNQGATASLNFACASPDTTLPLISGVGSSNVTTSSGIISWTTNEAATSQVEYGTTSSYGSSSVLDSSLVTTHTVNLSGLTAGTTYHYRVKSKDASGNEATSGDKTFGTSQPAAPIEILSYGSYVDGLDAFWVVGEVKNNSSNKLRFVRITATFYNAAGTVVCTDFTYTSIDTLLPNQKSPFDLYQHAVPSAQVDHYALAVSHYDMTTEDPYRGFTILSHSSYEDSLDALWVVGEVNNTGNQAATFVDVVATFYDAAGNAVATSSSYTDPHDLAAGQTAPFAMFVAIGWRTGVISTYELQVQC